MRRPPELPWGVVRVNDDGRTEIVNRDMCAAAAETVAGVLRDASDEDQLAEGWNFLPRKLKAKRRRMLTLTRRVA